MGRDVLGLLQNFGHLGKVDLKSPLWTYSNFLSKKDPRAKRGHLSDLIYSNRAADNGARLF
jgi:hypothetical protein